MNYDNQIQNLNSYLREKFELGQGANFLPNDEWINIFSNLRFQSLYKDGKPLKEKEEGVFTRINDDMEGDLEAWAVESGLYKTRHDYVMSPNDPIDYYPFNFELLSKIVNLKKLYVGNAELGETIRINHIEPIRYLCNLEELCICNNTVTSLQPVWNHSNLTRIWIENTLIPLEERKLFREAHPNCELAEQVYL